MVAGITTIGIILGLIIGIPLGLIVAVNVTWNEGVETTVTGTVQLHILSYDKVWKMDFTDIELRTYSGDTHHVRLFGHIDLEYRHTYRIRYTRRDYWAHIKIVKVPLEITELEGNNSAVF